jgi:tetratricopeptide (TPR) repeat protein
MWIEYIKGSTFTRLHSTNLSEFADLMDSNIRNSLIKTLEEISLADSFDVIKRRLDYEVYTQSNRIIGIRINDAFRLVVDIRIINKTPVCFILPSIENHDYLKSVVERDDARLNLLNLIDERITQLPEEMQNIGTPLVPNFYYRGCPIILTAPQKNVSEHICGVVVIGAAGTGKTLTGAARFINSLQHGLHGMYISPSPILKEEMQRLISENSNLPSPPLFVTEEELLSNLEQLFTVPPRNSVDYSYFLNWFNEQQATAKKSGPNKGSSICSINVPYDLYVEFTQVLLQPGEDLAFSHLSLSTYQKLAPNKSYLPKVSRELVYQWFQRFMQGIPPDYVIPNVRAFELYQKTQDAKKMEALKQRLPIISTLFVDEFQKMESWILHLLFALLDEPKAGQWTMTGDLHQNTERLRKKPMEGVEQLLQQHGIHPESVYCILETVHRCPQKVCTLANTFLRIEKQLWGFDERAAAYGLTVDSNSALGSLSITKPGDRVSYQNTEISFANFVKTQPNILVLIPNEMDITVAKNLFGPHVMHVSGSEGIDAEQVVVYGFSKQGGLAEVARKLGGQLPEANSPLSYGRKSTSTSQSAHNCIKAIYTAVTRATKSVIFCDDEPAIFLSEIVNHTESDYLSAPTSQEGVTAEPEFSKHTLTWYDLINRYCETKTPEALAAAEGILLGDQICNNTEERLIMSSVCQFFTTILKSKAESLQRTAGIARKLENHEHRTKWLNLIKNSLDDQAIFLSMLEALESGAEPTFLNQRNSSPTAPLAQEPNSATTSAPSIPTHQTTIKPPAEAGKQENSLATINEEHNPVLCPPNDTPRGLTIEELDDFFGSVKDLLETDKYDLARDKILSVRDYHEFPVEMLVGCKDVCRQKLAKDLSPRLWEVYAMICYIQGSYPEAIKAFNCAYKSIKASDAETLVMRGNAYLWTENDKAALANYQLAQKQSPSAKLLTYIFLLQLEHSISEHEECLRSLNLHCRDNNPSRVRAIIYSITLNVILQQCDDGLRLYNNSHQLLWSTYPHCETLFKSRGLPEKQFNKKYEDQRSHLNSLRTDICELLLVHLITFFRKYQTPNATMEQVHDKYMQIHCNFELWRKAVWQAMKPLPNQRPASPHNASANLYCMFAHQPIDASMPVDLAYQMRKHKN